jgi:transcriptional regulator of acetoin/glycerol metabolism
MVAHQQQRQREHIHAVMHLAGHGQDLTPDMAALHTPDDIIRSSWQRCVHQHRLDPTRMQQAVILPAQRVREHQEQLDEFLRIARHGLESLYQQVAGMGYCVLLTDARGVTVDFIGDLQLDASLRRAGLYLGSDWSEHHAGTCGVGTAIATGQALTVHQEDHFDATHIPLTCTAAPVYDPVGRLNAILDISALTSPQAKSSQHLALQLVKVYAHHVENANFLRWFRNDWVLKLNPSPEFVDVNPEFLLALDAGGRVIGHNRRAQCMLQAELAQRGSALAAAPLIGQPFEALFAARFNELGRFVHSHPSEQRALTLAASGRLLFASATPPPSRWATAGAPGLAAAAAAPAVPRALAALSGGDARLQRQIERAARLVNSPVSLLITGETGSGKEFFAKALHESGARCGRPFVAVNCAAIPEGLIESELFGHTAGSFTGALARGKRGLIMEADGGTLFLDEIGDMPPPAQARLLRVLAEREVLPVGAARPVPVDLRVVSATHRDLEALVRQGRFRDDLYYRLNGAHFQLPPLRERSDLPWLVGRLLARGPQPAPAVAPEAMAWLKAWHWPGNLRELHNVLEVARAVCSGGYIRAADLPDDIVSAARSAAALPPAGDALAALPPEAQLLLQYLRAAHWNVSVVARQLGVARMTLYRRMKRWGLHSPLHED